jgi:maltose/moltooligosaccharide transporter
LNSPAAQIYSVGTLRYDRRQLVVLFFWLMWNDFSITIIERIGTLSNVLMKNEGATFTQMAMLASIGGILNPWINPWVSTWSDRLRSRFGRRRPFLLVATPFFAFFLMAVPFMPDFYHFLLHFPLMKEAAAHFPMGGEALFIGVCGIISGLFNAVVLAIFQYLYWDVVPLPLMGRFNSLSKTVTTLAAVIWLFFIVGYADTHVKTV